MTDKRARASALCMAEAVPFGQHFVYHGEDGPDVTLSPGYFETVRDFLRVGDVLRIVEVREGRVRSVVGAIVIAPGKSGPIGAPERASGSCATYFAGPCSAVARGWLVAVLPPAEVVRRRAHRFWHGPRKNFQASPPNLRGWIRRNIR